MWLKQTCLHRLLQLTLPTAASPRRTSLTLLLGRAAEVVEGSAILVGVSQRRGRLMNFNVRLKGQLWFWWCGGRWMNNTLMKLVAIWDYVVASFGKSTTQSDATQQRQSPIIFYTSRIKLPLNYTFAKLMVKKQAPLSKRLVTTLYKRHLLSMGTRGKPIKT